MRQTFSVWLSTARLVENQNLRMPASAFEHNGVTVPQEPPHLGHLADRFRSSCVKERGMEAVCGGLFSEGES